ncbi:TonB family protein [Prevotella sp.]|uniref:TonB family protein n=1 Tax=Prevotella sp. TaxID=59823 RepID=UPI002F93C847
MAIYLLKINLALLLLYSFYWLVVSRDTFFSLRRFTLMAIYGVSLLVPALDVAYWIKDTSFAADMAVSYADNVLPALMAYANAPSVTVKDLFLYLYIVVVALLGLRLVWQLLVIIGLAHTTPVSEINGIKVHNLLGKEGPFSFFRWIFLNPDGQTQEQLQEIMVHERTHVAQWHSVDTIVAELFCIVCWFNPFAWLMKREVRINLEFLADEKVVAGGNARKAYQYHLLGLAYHPSRLDVANNFNVLPLKKRIKMMNKRRTKEIGKAKYLLLVPLAVTLLLVSNIEAVARTLTNRLPVIGTLTDRANELLESEMKVKPESSALQADEIAMLVDEAAPTAKKITISGSVRDEKGQPIVGAIVKIKGSKKGTVTDREGRYQLKDVEENELVDVMYVGLATTSFRAKAGQSDVVLKAETAIEQDGVFAVVERMPSFPGGSGELRKYIGKNLAYPNKDARGNVIIQFVVGKDGSINSPRIVKSVSQELDKAALDMVKGMPKWEPGMQNGKVVDVKYTIPIRFHPAEEARQTAKATYVVFVDGKKVDSIDGIEADKIESVEIFKDEASKKKYDTGDKSVMLVKLKKK